MEAESASRLAVRESVPEAPFGLEEPEPKVAGERLALGGRSIREHTARGVLINAAFSVALTALGFISRVVIAAFLTASEFGLWGLLVTTLISLMWLKQVGISEKFVQQDEPDQELAFQKAFTLELAYTLAFYVVVLAVLPLYALIYGREEILVPGLVLSLAIPASALMMPIWVPYRQMRFVRQRILEAITPVVMFTVGVGLAIAGVGYWALVAGAVAGTFAGAAAALITCPYPIALRFDRGTLREYFSFSWPLFLVSASSLAVVQGAVIVGNFAVGLAGLGALALAATFVDYVDSVDNILRRSMYPAVCAVRDRRDLLFEAFTKSNHLALIWGIPFGVGLTLFAPDLVDFVLGEKWEVATGLLQALGMILALRQVAWNWSIFFNAVGETRPLAVQAGVSVVVFFAVTVPLMFTLGLTGYAIGMTAVILAEIAVRTHFLSKLFGTRRVLNHVLRAALPTLPAAAVVLAARGATSGDRTIELALVELALYLAVAVAATFLLERRLVKEVVGYVRGGPRPAPAA